MLGIEQIGGGFMGKVAWAYKAISYHLLLLVVMEKKNHFSLKLRFSPIDKAGFLF